MLPLLCHSWSLLQDFIDRKVSLATFFIAWKGQQFRICLATVGVYLLCRTPTSFVSLSRLKVGQILNESHLKNMSFTAKTNFSFFDVI